MDESESPRYRLGTALVLFGSTSVCTDTGRRYHSPGGRLWHIQKGLQTTSKRAKRKVAAIAQNAYESAAAISREIDYKAMMYYKIAKVNTDLSHNVILADQYKQKAMSIAPDSEAARLAGSL